MKPIETYHIYLDGRHYDCMYAPSKDAERFWADRARETGGPILELGCGTGRVTLPLAREGFDITGIDLAPSMLERAREKAAAEDVAVEWVEGDIRSFDIGRRFDLIFLPGNTVCHLLDRESLEHCLACIRAHLTPTGHFVVTVFVPDPSKLLDASTQREPYAEYDDPDGRGRVVVTCDYRYERDTQVKRITTYHRLPGVNKEVMGKLEMRMFFPQELDALLEYNGFEIVHKWGGLDERPFDASSEFQVVVCASVG